MKSPKHSPGGRPPPKWWKERTAKCSERQGEPTTTPERWKALKQPVTARPRAPARMPGLDALEFSAMCVPTENAYRPPHLRNNTASRGSEPKIPQRESKSPQRPHDKADSPPASSVSKDITQLTVGEPPSEAPISYHSLTVEGLKEICEKNGISIPLEARKKNEIVQLLSKTFPDTADILVSIPLRLFTIDSLRKKSKSLGLPTHIKKSGLIEQLESCN